MSEASLALKLASFQIELRCTRIYTHTDSQANYHRHTALLCKNTKRKLNINIKQKKFRHVGTRAGAIRSFSSLASSLLTLQCTHSTPLPHFQVNLVTKAASSGSITSNAGVLRVLRASSTVLCCRASRCKKLRAPITSRTTN